MAQLSMTRAEFLHPMIVHLIGLQEFHSQMLCELEQCRSNEWRGCHAWTGSRRQCGSELIGRNRQCSNCRWVRQATALHGLSLASGRFFGGACGRLPSLRGAAGPALSSAQASHTHSRRARSYSFSQPRACGSTYSDPFQNADCLFGQSGGASGWRRGRSSR